MIPRQRDIVVIGGSAGAFSALLKIVPELPALGAASYFVAIHRGASAIQESKLRRVLATYTDLDVLDARDGMPIERGKLYVAPADRHTLLEDGLIRVHDGPKEQQFRPCIDVLFKSAAAVYGQRVAGVLLSGSFGNDGAAGLWHIERRGGVTLVQDPADAEHKAMPATVLSQFTPHRIVPAAGIARALQELEPADAPPAQRARILVVEDEVLVAANLQLSLDRLGYEVVACVERGDDALALAEELVLDLVVMDIRLAGELDGIDTARRLWERRQLPVVYSTAHADLDTLASVQASEHYGYLVKPYDDLRIRAAIELALARRERELR